MFSMAILLGALVSGPTAAPSADSIPQLEKMVVTATRKETPLKDVPSISYVADASEISSIGATRSSDALEYIPGVNVEGGTGSGTPFKKNVSINGMPSHYSLILVDGMRLLSSHFHTGADVAMIPAENIERIEVIKDAGSAQYGSDAMGGVVNIITRKGQHAPALRFSTSAGSQRTYRGNISVSGTTGENILHHSYVGWSQTDGLPILKPTHRLGQLDFKNLSVTNRVSASINESNVLSTNINYFTVEQTFRDSRMDSRLFIPQVELTTELDEDASLNTQAYYTRWEGEINNELNEIITPQVNFSYSGLPRQQLLIGGEYNWRQFQRKAVPKHSQHAFGIYIQDELKMSEKIVTLAALRMDMTVNESDDVKNAGPVFSPKLSALYRPVDMLSFRISAGRGFKAPAVQDLYEQGYGHGFDLRYGNPDLQPEYSTSGSFGIELNTPIGLSLSLNGFGNLVTDMIALINEGTSDSGYVVYRRQNINEALVGGGEITATYTKAFGKVLLNTQTGFSISHNQDRETGEILPYYPGQTFHFKMNPSVNITPQFSLGLFAGLKTGMGRQLWNYKTGEITDLKDYQKLDAGISAKIFNNYELFCKGSNLLGQEIESYEDLLMVTEGKRTYEFGFRAAAF